jgi:hypothetical protein
MQTEYNVTEEWYPKPIAVLIMHEEVTIAGTTMIVLS